MIEALLDFVANNGGGFSLSAMTMVGIIHVSRQQKKMLRHAAVRDENLALHTRAHKMQLKRLLREMHTKCKEKKYVSDEDLEIWTETFDIYTALGGNGVAKAWHKDIVKWRS
jgi:hypothetical protein